MLGNLFWLGVGVVCGVVFQATLRPYIDKGWAAVRDGWNHLRGN